MVVHTRGDRSGEPPGIPSISLSGRAARGAFRSSGRRRIASILPAGWLLLALLGYTSPAFPCSSGPQVLATSVDGVLFYPANAAVLLEVVFLGTGSFTVSINDAPASLIEVPELSYEGEVLNYMVPEPSILAARLSPTPEEGDSIHLELSDCAFDCGNYIWEWTAGPPDTSPPVPLSSFDLDLFQYPTFAISDYCTYEAFRRSWYFDPVRATSAGESIELYRLEVRAPGSQDVLYTDTWYLDSLFAKEWRWDTVLPEDDGEATALCFTLIPMDLASQVGGSITTCQPRYCRAETQPLYGADDVPELPPEPVWTESDRFTDGQCRVTSHGEDTPPASGCGCSTAAPGEDPSSSADGSPTPATAGGAVDGDKTQPTGCACSDPGPSYGKLGSGWVLGLLVVGGWTCRRRRGWHNTASVDLHLEDSWTGAYGTGCQQETDQCSAIATYDLSK